MIVKKQLVDFLKKRPIQNIGIVVIIVYMISYFSLRSIEFDSSNPKAQVQVYFNIPPVLSSLHKLYIPICKLEAKIRYGTADMFVHTSSGKIYLY